MVLLLKSAVLDCLSSLHLYLKQQRSPLQVHLYFNILNITKKLYVHHLRLCDRYLDHRVCPVTASCRHWKGKFKCVFISLTLRVNQNKGWYMTLCVTSCPFQHKTDLDRCIWFSSTVLNHKTFLSSFITHNTPGTGSLIASEPTCLRRDGPPFLFYSFYLSIWGDCVICLCLTSPLRWTILQAL